MCVYDTQRSFDVSSVWLARTAAASRRSAVVRRKGEHQLDRSSFGRAGVVSFVRTTVQMSTLGDDFDRPFEDPEPLQWGALREVCCASVDHFASHQDDSGVRIKAALLAILDHLDQLQPLYREIVRFAPEFDFDVETPANGYRSFLSLVDMCIEFSGQVCRQMYSYRNSMLFRKSYHMK